MLKYEYDLKRLERRADRLRDDIHEDDVDDEDDEGLFNDAESKRFQEYIKQQREDIKSKAEKITEDTPYDTQKDEQNHEWQQFDDLKQKLEDLKPEDQKFKEQLIRDKYMQEYEQMAEIDNTIEEDNQVDEEFTQAEAMREQQRVMKKVQKGKDAFYNRKSKKTDNVWRDED